MWFYRAFASYGVVRTAIVLHLNPEIKAYNFKKKEYQPRKLLASEWLGAMIYGTALTTVMAPLAVAKDVHDIDLFFNGYYANEKFETSHHNVVAIIHDSLFC